MKKFFSIVLSLFCLAGAVHAANLVLNGSFELQANGTSVTTPPAVIDTTTFTAWRFYNVATSDITSFNATIIPTTDTNSGAGTNAMRLNIVNSTGGGGGSYALDTVPHWVAVNDAVPYYLISFDAAWIAGAKANNLALIVAQFDGNGTFLGQPIYSYSISNSTYQTFNILYSPAPGTGRIIPEFLPMLGVVGATTLSLDNVKAEIPALPVNGSFEYSPMGTQSTSGTGGLIDGTTFLGWRLFNVGSPAINSFTGTIVDAGSYAGGTAGSHALRLAVNNTGSPVGNDYALDNLVAQIPVAHGVHYTLSFDLAWVSVTGGTMACDAQVAEYNAAGSYTGNATYFTPTLPTDQTFHHYSVDYVVQNTNTAKVVISFRPRNPGFVSTLVLDNVEFNINFNTNSTALFTYTLTGVSTSAGYDEAVAVASLQGNINRTNPTLYVKSGANARPQTWLNIFTNGGGWLAGRDQVGLPDLNALLMLAGNKVKGVVIWDTNVPATINVATTIAGVEDAVVLSPDLAATYVAQWGLPVTKDLRGVFAGSGTVNFYGVSFASTGSAKNDAYRWAIQKYLNPRLCSKKFVCYYEDAFTARAVNGGGNSADYAVTRDWAVANRSFVYDLSPWGDEAPTDDLGQTLGTDLATYTNMLGAVLNQTAGTNMTELCGFFPFAKYSNAFDPTRKHGDVATEWETVYLITPYNIYQNTAAGSCFDQSLHHQAPITLPLTNHRPQVAKSLENKTYLCVFMADYDSAAPLYEFLPDKWSDPQRGTIPLLWGINPNLVNTYPDVINYFYQTATTNDYFAADASAAGYMNPNRVQAQYLPLFVNHNQYYYSNLDMTISPMVLDWDQPSSAVKDAFAQFSPDGYSTIILDGFPNTAHNLTGTAPTPQVWNGMPILNLVSAGSSAATASYLTANLPQAGAQPTFNILRIVWETPSQVITAINQLKANRPDLNIEVVDPYNFFRLAKQNMGVSTNLPGNGSFESSPIGTSATITTATVNTTAFAGWRFFSVGSPPINSFIGTIVDAGNYTGGQPGSHAMRLAVNNIGSPAEFDYGLDNEGYRIPVTVGTRYTLAFDVALDSVTGGTELCEASIAEFDASGAWLGNTVSYTPTLPTDQTFHHYSVNYAVQNTNTAKVVISFRPRNPGFVSAVVLDNVLLLSDPVVAWGMPTTISGDSDASTNGVLDRAYNLGDAGVAATTVNGVTFAPFAASPGYPTGSLAPMTVGQTTLTPLGGGNLYGYSGFGSGSSPFSTLSGAYQALLSKGCFDWDVSHNFTLTLNNLTVGATYQIQIWANDSQNTGASVRDTRVGTSTNLVTLHQNSGWSSGVGASGGVGQYVIGTFTANNPAQLFTFDQPTNNSLTINAFQLRVLPSYANTPTNISYSVGRSTLTLTWPGSHQGWIAQSNSVNLENTNDWFNIAGSASVTNLNIPMSQSGNVFYRLRHP